MKVKEQKFTDFHPPFIISLVTDPKAQGIFALVSLVLIVVFISSFYLYTVDEGLLLFAETGGEIIEVFSGGPAERAGLREGDVILTIAGQPLDPWLRHPLFPAGVKAGDILAHTIERNGQVLTIPVQVETFFDDFGDTVAVLGIQFVAVVFWVLGLLLILFSSPGDLRARLIGLSWLLVGVSAAAGGPGILSRFWGAGVGLIVGWSWLSVTLVAAHLYFPGPVFSSRVRHAIIWILTATALVISVLDILDEWVFKSAGWSLAQHGLPIDQIGYLFAALAMASSIGLLIRNHFFAKDLDVKRQTRIVLWGTVLALSPFLVLTLIPILLLGPDGAVAPGGLTVLFVVILALVYAYVIRQRELLQIDFIINRLVVFFVLAMLVLLSSTLIFSAFAFVFNLPSELPLLGGAIATLIALPSATIQKRVQAQINRVLYGSHYDFSTVTASLSSRLAQTLDQPKLIELLTGDLAKQMGIRRTTLFLADGNKLVLQPAGDSEFAIDANDEMCKNLLEARIPVRAEHLWKLLTEKTVQRWQRLEWGVLFVPIIFQSSLHGILILGPRAASDVYSEQDVQIIATVAYQAALAAENVRLVETLRGLAQDLVRDNEAQRKSLARDLHDAVLQNLFFLKKRLAEVPGQEDLNGHLDHIMGTLRQTIRAQRPPMLDQGLPLALEDLVNEMQRVNETTPIISWHCESSEEVALDDEAAISVYRIAQEALSNALRHARAEYVNVSLKRDNGHDLRLTVEDDGVGLSMNGASPNASQTGYGLVGMRERALMVGADLEILGEPGEGTTVTLRFKA